ncbi:IbrB-like domain-containing protein [Ralstonia pseudosolanacearum]|uniref:IbrB-like domain-containing protein n=1 Tax=Ralstonia pseudosolanacearum TaxID=1310165 RepID=UPI0007D87A47|nr:ParB/RepB/Spo0J family partition protein [Ralstonia pseudosolanacearum]MDC6291776.1 ParB/RepB/Spo0J family partition protein [Ralstonia pseudosolanacearum]MDD7787731.1 ParB/RepB/Spo0J family partition protein [Ralstonia pseudosolanacearum]MDN3369024.1 ParB/RepB/Spo0J family partition protein [Ralstonia pseudosolanacearum]MDO3527167.1 ParB/RepB/Spo0J family partition protein [Ralstonia pseudosolanacearum]MDO3531772.1 ParB/RepB/Spo0J family partition protein [Ralstonia pseudosolanacearum]
MKPHDLLPRAEALFRELDGMPLAEKVAALNALRRILHAHSPFRDEPTDCVQWVQGDLVHGNTYNPNAIAPPEMALLERSIRADGYTQPIVTHRAPLYFEVVDGFHRQRIGTESMAIRARLHGYLPIVAIRADRGGVDDRIAATIRHNRARGVHGVRPMTEVVIALLRAGWSDSDVAAELGMDSEEVFRFKQVSGLPELFRDRPYSMSWD